MRARRSSIKRRWPDRARAALIGARDDEAVAVTAGAHALPPLQRLALPSGSLPLRGIVERDAQQTVVSWHYSKARELLFFLVDAPQRTRGQIVPRALARRR